MKKDNPPVLRLGGDSNYIVYRSYTDSKRTYNDLGDMLDNFTRYNDQKSQLRSFTDAVTSVLLFIKFGHNDNFGNRTI